MTITRRVFLGASVLAAGGLTLGVVLHETGEGRSLTPAHSPNASAVHSPNAWVHIGEDNAITLITARSEMGQGVYTALPMLIAEELGVSLQSITVRVAPVDAVYTNVLLGGQLTGGSTSVREGWDKLRIAGAQVRMMLIAAAAQAWAVPLEEIDVRNGHLFGPNGLTATFGDFASAAANLPVPQKVVLKDPKDFKIIGKRTLRLDTPAKVNGTARFGIDVVLPGMVYAPLLQCPVIGGKPLSFDAVNARKMPGVIDVVQISDGVAVVADTFWRARKARDQITVVWDEGPVARLDNKLMMEEIRKTDGAVVKINKIGDSAAAMASASKTIKAEYETQMLAHATMEPQNCTAHFSNGKCLLIGPFQFQQGAGAGVAAALKIKPADVNVETTFLGGGFGRRIEYDFAVQAAEISNAVGKPVKLVWTREDDTTHDFYRPMALHRMAAGLDSIGGLTALTLDFTSQSITQRAFGLSPSEIDPFMVEAAVVGYQIPNMLQQLIVHDTGLRAGYWRSVSNNMNAFANESFIDEIAAAVHHDPLAFRLSMLTDRPRHANVLKIAAAKAGWHTKPATGRARGIALMESYDTFMAQIAEVSLEGGQIKVHKVWVVADLGRMVNPDTVEAQLQSSIIFGLSAALGAEITMVKGRVQQTNFHDNPVLRMSEVPDIDITLIDSAEKPGGIGEPATALIGPAVGNALFAATGKRLRKMPFSADSLKAT